MQCNTNVPFYGRFKNLSAFTCRCPNCGEEKEIFSDEFAKKHTCSGCHREIDFVRCQWEAGAETKAPP